MEIVYDKKTNAMYIEFNNKDIARTRVVIEGRVLVDLAEDGSAVGVELIAPADFVDDLDKVIYKVENKVVETQ
jgi:uncharacterized protein YuzE